MPIVDPGLERLREMFGAVEQVSCVTVLKDGRGRSLINPVEMSYRSAATICEKFAESAVGVAQNLERLSGDGAPTLTVRNTDKLECGWLGYLNGLDRVDDSSELVALVLLDKMTPALLNGADDETLNREGRLLTDEERTGKIDELLLRFRRDAKDLMSFVDEDGCSLAVEVLYLNESKFDIVVDFSAVARYYSERANAYEVLAGVAKQNVDLYEPQSAF
jgi:hypothetical protein